MSGHGDPTRIDPRKTPQKRERRGGFPRCLSLEQLELRLVAALVPARGEGTAHELALGEALIGGEPDTAPKEVEKNILVPGEHRPYRSGLRSGDGVVGSIAAVVEQHGGEWAATPRRP